jgi:hypothetical protein
MRLRHATVVHRRSKATERLKIRVGIERAMRGDEKIPLVSRASLRDDATHRVARSARRLGARVGRVPIVDHAPLGLEARRLHLRRRQALMVAQVTNDRPGVLGIEVEVVQPDHATHGHLPAFGCFALEGNSLHDAGAILLVAPDAVTDDRAFGDRKSARRIGRGTARATVSSRGAAAAAAALRMSRPHGEGEDQRRDQQHAERSATTCRHHTGHRTFAPVRVSRRIRRRRLPVKQK